MFSIGDGVDSDISVLAGSENVLAVVVYLHVVQCGFADHVVAPGELGQAPLVALDFPEDDGLVCAARHHLKLVLLLLVLNESDGRDRAAVVVQRRDKVVVSSGVEDVDEPVPGGRGEQVLPLSVSGLGVLEAEDPGVVGLNLAHLVHELQLVDPDVSGSVPGS